MGEFDADGLDLGVGVWLDVRDGLDAEVVVPFGGGEVRDDRQGAGSAGHGAERKTETALLVDEGVGGLAAVAAAVPLGVQVEHALSDRVECAKPGAA